MPAMVINCILLVPTAKRFWIFMWWKRCRIFFSPYIWYRTVILQQAFCNLYQWLLCIDIYCQDTGICTSLPLLYNDEYRKQCLDHAGIHRVLCEVQMIYNMRLSYFIYVCTYGHFKRWWILQTQYILSFIAYRFTWIYHYNHFKVLNALSPGTIFYHVLLHEMYWMYYRIVFMHCILYMLCQKWRNKDIQSYHIIYHEI